MELTGTARKMTEKHIREAGQSGAKLRFYTSENNNLVVEKIFPGDRLRPQKQFQKHLEAYLSRNMRPIGCPKPLTHLEDNGYKMEFISGALFGEQLELVGTREFKTLIEPLLHYLENSFEQSSPKRFLNKLEMNTLKLKIESYERVHKEKSTDAILSLKISLQEYLPKLQVWEGWNHGDFSMDNLIIDTTTFKVWAIDFLDSPIQTPLLDLGRIYLDTKILWLGSIDVERRIVEKNFRMFERLLLDFCESYGVSQEQLHWFLGFSVLRIWPYTEDALRLSKLNSAARVALGNLRS